MVFFYNHLVEVIAGEQIVLGGIKSPVENAVLLNFGAFQIRVALVKAPLFSESYVIETHVWRGKALDLWQVFIIENVILS